MNRNDLYQSFHAIDDDILERSEQRACAGGRAVRRRLWVGLTAALLGLLLMGAGAVAVIYGDSIQNWFGHYFGVVTGQEMSRGQSALIEHLSQDIGQRRTVQGTTVTVDSVTVGDDSFYLLLRVEGVRLSKRHSYHFDALTLEVSPDPLAGERGIGSQGIAFKGLDGDGAALFLVEYAYAAGTEFTADTTPLEVHLLLEDFMRGPQTKKRKTITAGVWAFDFTIDRSQPPEIIALPDTEVTGMDLHAREDIAVLLTHMELTNTGIRFRYDTQGGAIDLKAQFSVLLKSGADISYSEGSSVPMSDQTTMNCSYHWEIPVELEEVAAVQIGSTTIPVP
mgnify:CR=1 FL=1